MSIGAVVPWVALAVLVLVAYAVGHRQGAKIAEQALIEAESTTPLQPIVQPMLVYGGSPSGSNTA